MLLRSNSSLFASWGLKSDKKAPKFKSIHKVAVLTSDIPAIVLTHCHCQTLSGASQTTDFCTLKSANLEKKNKYENANKHNQQMQKNYHFSQKQQQKKKNIFFKSFSFLPGGKMLSLSRMRADAKSLMMYWRRTCLNTERKGKPSSVSKKGSLSHRSVGQSRFSRTYTKTTRETRRSPVGPVLRLHSQASASARSCLIGPSHKVLSCRNIHCGGRNIEKGGCGNMAAQQGLLGITLVHLFQSCVHIHFHLHDKQVRRLDEKLHHLSAVMININIYNRISQTCLMSHQERP